MSPAKPAPFPMAGYPCGRDHTSTIRMQEAGGFFTLLGGQASTCSPWAEVTSLHPPHSSPQHHFDGRAQDSREFPFFQTILHLGPLSLQTSSQYLCLPPDIHYLLFP